MAPGSRGGLGTAYIVRRVAERDLDVVVFGATGVTGRRVAAIPGRAGGGDRRALGGGGARPREARAGPRRGSASPRPRRSSPIVDDPASLAAMASRARVVLNLVGPYTLYGRPVIEACVAERRPLRRPDRRDPVRAPDDRRVRRPRRAGGREARAGLRLRGAAADLAVLLAAETARERWGEGLAEADLEVSVKGPPGLPRPSDMISGGTLQSLAAAAGGEDASAVTDPAALITDPDAAEEVRRRSPITVAPRRVGRRGDRADGARGVHQPGRDPAHRRAARGRERHRAEPFRYREGARAAGGGRHAAAALRGWRACSPARRPRWRPRPVRGRRCGGAWAARSSADPSLVRVRACRAIASRRGGGACRSRRAPPADTRCGSTSTPTATRDTSRPRGCWARPGCCSPSRGATPERAGCLTPATALGTASRRALRARAGAVLRQQLKRLPQGSARGAKAAARA